MRRCVEVPRTGHYVLQHATVPLCCIPEPAPGLEDDLDGVVDVNIEVLIIPMLLQPYSMLSLKLEARYVCAGPERYYQQHPPSRRACQRHNSCAAQPAPRLCHANLCGPAHAHRFDDLKLDTVNRIDLLLVDSAQTRAIPASGAGTRPAA